MKAVDDKEWAEAAQWMRKAASEQSQEGEQVKLYGVRFEPYLPSYYLGLALFQAGDCVGAVAAWQESERQGAVQGSARYKNLVQGRDTCKQRLAAKTPPPPPAPPRPVGPDPAELARAAQEAEAQVQKGVEAQGRLDRRQNEIREARKAEETERLARETREKEEQRKRADEAARAEGERLAQARAEQERTRHQEAIQGIGRAAADAKIVLDRATAKPGDAESQRRQAALRDLLRQSAKVGDGTPLPEIDRLRSGLSTAATRLDEALLKAQGDTGPPAALRAAARAFFRADYEEVVRGLGAASFTEPRAAAAGHLLLAAARYALYLQGGEKEAKLRQQAIDQIHSCRKINAKISPDRRIFSPRFTEFFKAAG
ncbi:MAG TPA: hypothetical protein VGR07_11145 [Thermoanaerobaculia bacterium]|jgi:hypothetical protein|nr:hypothetical protein [Thermoanaerobaculia bacterium]